MIMTIWSWHEDLPALPPRCFGRLEVRGICFSCCRNWSRLSWSCHDHGWWWSLPQLIMIIKRVDDDHRSNWWLSWSWGLMRDLLVNVVKFLAPTGALSVLMQLHNCWQLRTTFDIFIQSQPKYHNSHFYSSGSRTQCNAHNKQCSWSYKENIYRLETLMLKQQCQNGATSPGFVNAILNLSS